jgi:hypothetical protein
VDDERNLRREVYGHDGGKPPRTWEELEDSVRHPNDDLAARELLSDNSDPGDRQSFDLQDSNTADDAYRLAWDVNEVYSRNTFLMGIEGVKSPMGVADVLSEEGQKNLSDELGPPDEHEYIDVRGAVGALLDAWYDESRNKLLEAITLAVKAEIKGASLEEIVLFVRPDETEFEKEPPPARD